MTDRHMKQKRSLPVALTTVLLVLSAGAAGAAPLVLNNISAAQAALRLSARYHVNIVLKANANRRVNIALEDADDAGTRLQTVNALANALKLDFTKTFVVSKATGIASNPAAVDSGVSIPFGRTRMPVREAITLIAGVDDAFAQISADVGGTVTLSRPTLPIEQAEEEVAKQTGTTWKTVYVLAPRDLTGFFASPLLVFPDLQREAQRRREEEAAERQAYQEQAAAYQAYQQAAARQQASLQATPQPYGQGGQAMNGQAMNGSGYYPNGYGYYGSPYQNSSYGNGSYGDSNAYGGYGFGSGGIVTSGNVNGNFPTIVVGGGQ